MALPLRLVLIIIPILAQIFIVVKIRKLKMKSEDAIFWLVFSAIIVLLGIFPGIAITISGWLGILSPANFVFLVIIALLLLKTFSLTTKLAVLERKFQSLVQDRTLDKMTGETTGKEN